jgi:hypothetical protein
MFTFTQKLISMNMNTNGDKNHRAELDRIAFYGRTLSEYLMMFNISDVTPLKNYDLILDCPSGASSFVAEATKCGINAVGCDPLFGTGAQSLCKQGEKDIEYVVKRVSETPDLYKWDFYSSLEVLRQYRKWALNQFLSDYDSGLKEKRYVKGKLPHLPFEDKSFELVLSGHFLFTYSSKFNFSFILRAILELIRVCSREVRIYPIQKSSFQPYAEMTELLSILEKKHGINHEIMPVKFEFQRGSNKMLLLKHNNEIKQNKI